MKNLYVVLSTALMLYLLIGCSSISVTSDYDPSVDFAAYKSFDINRESIKGSELENAPLVKKRVLEAIEKVMKQKGYILDESGNADLIVFTHAGTNEKMSVTDWGYGYGAWWGPYPYGGRNIDVSYYTQGSLFIDLVDNAKDELVWRGVGTAVLKNQGTPEERQQFIDEAVTKILSEYPPQ